MMKSEEYKRGYDAGYKQALLDALSKGGAVELYQKEAVKPSSQPPASFR